MKDFVNARSRLKTPLRYWWLMILNKVFLENNKAKIVIDESVSDNRTTYHDLFEDEKRTLVAELIDLSEQALIDADTSLTLQKAVAEVIRRSGDAASMQNLYSEINKIFISGDKMTTPFFSEAIDDALENEWRDRYRRPNEHFQHDVMQRNRDIRMTSDRLNQDHPLLDR